LSLLLLRAICTNIFTRHESGVRCSFTAVDRGSNQDLHIWFHVVSSVLGESCSLRIPILFLSESFLQQSVHVIWLILPVASVIKKEGEFIVCNLFSFLGYITNPFKFSILYNIYWECCYSSRFPDFHSGDNLVLVIQHSVRCLYLAHRFTHINSRLLSHVSDTTDRRV